ncbi:hypothetical protein V6V47_01820 [Micromonospora sp. CPCC 205539]
MESNVNKLTGPSNPPGDTRGADDVVRAFEEAGLTVLLVDLRPGDSATV